MVAANNVTEVTIAWFCQLITKKPTERMTADDARLFPAHATNCGEMATSA